MEWQPVPKTLLAIGRSRASCRRLNFSISCRIVLMGPMVAAVYGLCFWQGSRLVGALAGAPLQDKLESP